MNIRYVSFLLLVSALGIEAQPVRLQDPKQGGQYLVQKENGGLSYSKNAQDATLFERIDMMTMQTMECDAFKPRKGSAQLKVVGSMDAWLDVRDGILFLNSELVDHGSWQAVPSVWEYTFHSGCSSFDQEFVQELNRKSTPVLNYNGYTVLSEQVS